MGIGGGPVGAAERGTAGSAGGVGLGNGRILIGGNTGFNETSITVSNGSYTIKARQGEVTFQVTGSIEGNELPKSSFRTATRRPKPMT